MTRTCDAADYLLATALHRYVPVEELLHLRPHVTRRLPAEQHPFSAEGATYYLMALEEAGFGTNSGQSTDYWVFERLLLNDFRSALASLTEQECQVIGANANYRALPDRILELLQTEFFRLGLRPPVGVVRFVEAFPEPFADRQYMALTLDAGDRAAHGVDPGVYLLSLKFIPIFAQPLILHEHIHVALGERDPNLLCRGLEEGICELLGSLYLGAKAIGAKAAENCFIYSRLRAKQPTIWTGYLEFTRQALTIYRHYGMAGIAEILRVGRSLLKDVERKLWAGEQNSLPLPKGDIDPEFLARSEWLLDVFARQMSVSPTAYHVMKYAHSGASVREVAQSSGLGFETTLSALEELAGHPRLLTLRSDKAVIACSEEVHLFSTHFLRYQIPDE